MVGGAAGPPPPVPRPPPRSAPVPAPVPLPGDDQATKLFAGSMLDQAELKVIRGSFKGTIVGLSAGTVVIGRSSDCELSLKGAQGVSRRHCKVQYLGKRFVIIDLESRNGTIVNGQSVERKVLEHGDRIEVGDETLEFTVESLNDLRDVPAPASSAHEESTALLPRARASAARRTEQAGVPPPPPPTSVDDEAPLQETLPPQAAAAQPAPPESSPVAATAELSSPYVHQPSAAPGGGQTPWVLGVFTLLTVVGGAWLIYDLGFRPASNDDAAVVDAPGIPAIAAVTVAVVDAGSAVAAVIDAGSPLAAVVVDAGAPAASEARVVRASVAGKATTVAVKVGDRVKVGDVLIVVAADSPNLMRKIESLRREEREFAESAKSMPSAKADLEGVRAELRQAESRLTPKTQSADSEGVVVEVAIAVGDTVRDGAAIITLAP